MVLVRGASMQDGDMQAGNMAGCFQGIVGRPVSGVAIDGDQDG